MANKGYLGGMHKGAAWKNGAVMSFGNKKMTIPFFSIPAMKTCKGSTELCRKYCYAKKAEELFPAVRAKRQRNLELSKTADFIDAVCRDLDTVPLMSYVRIHESGDFYSQAYLEKWYAIAEKFPEKTFLAFTKNFGLDFSKRPANLVIYFSVWADSNTAKIKDNTIKKAITVLDYKWAVKVGLDKKTDITGAEKCQGYCDKCLMCFKNSHTVYFPVH